MFDTSQLVQIEYITLFFASIFLVLGFKFDNKILGLIAALECILTTFMSRHELMSYWNYDGVKSDIAFIFYNASIVIVQTAVISIISVFYKSPWLILTYIFNILIVSTSFFVAQAVMLAPESNTLLGIQTLIDDKIYWYVYYLSMAFICAGIVRNGNRSGGGTRVISVDSHNMFNHSYTASKLAKIMGRAKRRVQNT